MSGDNSFSEEQKQGARRDMTNRVQLEVFSRDYVELAKTLIFTDSSNAYASILKGFSSASVKSLRATLAYIRDMAPLYCLSFVDKDFNVGDSGSKTKGWKHRLLHLLMKYNVFHFGFLGRTAATSSETTPIITEQEKNVGLHYPDILKKLVKTKTPVGTTSKNLKKNVAADDNTRERMPGESLGRMPISDARPRSEEKAPCKN